jgi:hypothetical protein
MKMLSKGNSNLWIQSKYLELDLSYSIARKGSVLYGMGSGNFSFKGIALSSLIYFVI